MAVEILKLACNHCGADLKVAEDTRFVTCTYCDTQLEVRREGGAAFTSVKEAVERLERQAEQMAGDLAVIRVEQEIERLDRDWEREREGLMVEDKEGGRYVPEEGRARAVIVLSVVLGLVFAVAVPLLLPGGEFMAIFGVLIGLAGVAAGLSHRARAEKYRRAEGAYEATREELENELRDLEP
jgi:hypothetical protein